MMSTRASGLDEVDLSDLIGAIYDCAIDPSRWNATLKVLHEVLDCAGCSLYVTDLDSSVSRLQSFVGIEQEWIDKYLVYAADAAAMMASVPDLMCRSLDEPVVAHRDIPEDIFLTSRYWQEWAVPQGNIDFITLNLVRDPGRVAGIALGRYEAQGLITDREVRLLRLLAPHLRRAVIISDLIDMKSIKAEALCRTLDLLPTAVVLVNEDAKILQTNSEAVRMIKEAAPILSIGGRLSVRDYETTRQLHRIVAMAARNDTQIGGSGIGMGLNGCAGSPATAHVLPIAEGALRSRLMPKGAAAVFIAVGDRQSATSLAPVAELFGLSKAETRVLERVIKGESLPEVASKLGISLNTAKTHMARLFVKTGTHRQAELIILLNRLLPSVSGPGEADD